MRCWSWVDGRLLAGVDFEELPVLAILLEEGLFGGDKARGEEPPLMLRLALAALKAHKMRVKIPWEVTSTFSEYLKEDSEGEDDDEIEAYEDSKKRLKVSSNAAREGSAANDVLCRMRTTLRGR